MKKKELLNIFLFTLILTGLGYFRVKEEFILGTKEAMRGFPIGWGSILPSELPGFIVDAFGTYSLPGAFFVSFVGILFTIFGFIFDFVFWFLILMSGRWVVEKFKTKK